MNSTDFQTHCVLSADWNSQVNALERWKRIAVSWCSEQEIVLFLQVTWLLFLAPRGRGHRNLQLQFLCYLMFLTLTGTHIQKQTQWHTYKPNLNSEITSEHSQKNDPWWIMSWGTVREVQRRKKAEVLWFSVFVFVLFCFLFLFFQILHPDSRSFPFSSQHAIPFSPDPLFLHFFFF